MRVLRRDEVPGLPGDEDRMLGIRKKILTVWHPDKKTGLQGRSLRDRNQKCSRRRILNIKARKENVCSVLWAPREDPGYCFPVSFSLFDCPS